MNTNAFECVVCLHWVVSGRLQDPLWKIVRMPSAPSADTWLVFECDIDVIDVKVEHLLWCENKPRWIEVHTEPFNVCCDAEMFASEMRSKGWRWDGQECMVDMIDQVAGDA